MVKNKNRTMKKIIIEEDMIIENELSEIKQTQHGKRKNKK
jgi:hypothetical protein